MNKHFLILLVCMNAAFTLSAQSSMNVYAGSLQGNRQNAVFREAIRNSRKTCSFKTTSISERLRSQSTYRFLDTAGTGVNLWLLNDSTYYLYSGSHGSEFDYTDLNYWDDFTLLNNGFIGMGTAMGRNDNFYKPDVLFDSAYCFHRYGDLVPYFISRNYYDNDDNIYNFSQTFLYLSVDSNNFAYTYDSNRIASRVYSRNNAGTGPDTIQTRRIAYTAGLISTDSSFYSSGAPGFLYRHTFDATGRSTRISMYQPDSASTGWYEALRYDFEYTAMGQVSRLTTSYKTDSASALHIAEDELATWTSGGMLSSIHYMYYLADTVYKRSGYAVHFSSVNGLPDTAVHADTTYSPTGILTGYYVQTIKYNGLNDPIKIDRYLNTAPVATDTPFMTRYYYYEFPESISNTQLSQLAIYPNPASDKLFFTRPNNVTGNERVAIYDLEGQIIGIETLNNGTININSLKPGTYLLVLTDGTGAKARQRFVKL